jgi:glycosyltransferase involved in cell wall biosynthesis
MLLVARSGPDLVDLVTARVGHAATETAIVRIALLYHDFSQRGGAERHVEFLARVLGELCHEVTIVSSTPPAGFRGFSTNFGRHAAPFSALRLACWLRRERIQLIHAHSRISALVACIAVRLYRIPLVVTSHILPNGLSRVSQWGDATICVSEAVRKRLIEDYGLSTYKATVIYNGVETGNVLPTATLCFGPQPVISFVARFAPGKGHEIFLKTASRMLMSGFPGTFVLAGAGPLERSLRARYGSDRIVFLGHRSDVPAILAGSTASVVCSESEAFPYVVLESLAVGTPVISTDCGGPAEVIRNGRNGYLFAVGDAESLHCLLVAVSNPGAGLAPRSEIAEECRRGFSLSRMLEATLGVYREVCPEINW